MILDGKIALQKKELGHAQLSKENISNKAGDIKKCPSCGAPVPSFTTKCKDCEFEFRNTEASNSAQSIFELLQKAATQAVDEYERNPPKWFEQNLTKDFAIIDIKYNDMAEFLPAIGNCKFNVLTPAGNLEIGTDNSNDFIDKLSENTSLINDSVNIDLKDANDENINVKGGPSSETIRRKQVQTINFNTTAGVSGLSFQTFVVEETGINYSGYAKINFPGKLDNVQHTLLQNTVWTIELDPETYKYEKSPSISGINNNTYLGAKLEPYIDQTQKFRVLDIEETEESKYKISALEYDEAKFMETDKI